ncbi:protein ALP1-like isoform X2 [Bufo gargarizans]|uniref:protein ALP1-like isoform X2 n=1 Tax=Bufo gargarizans TaxID=30331 RepID=UPI001CF518B2|nr:protein ALP1-like isoform X2 [Bufo gargarizans]
MGYQAVRGSTVRMEDGVNTVRVEDNVNIVRMEENGNIVRVEDNVNIVRIEDNGNMSLPPVRLPSAHMALLVLLARRRKLRRQEAARQKRLWIHPVIRMKQEKGTFAMLYADLRRCPEKFQEFIQMSTSAFDGLLDLLRPLLTMQQTLLRRCISPEQRLLITLRFLSTGETYSSLHQLFHVGKSTISGIIRTTCDLIFQNLRPSVMPAPTEETWLQVAEGFESAASFPNCIGAVDGKHLRVHQPPHSGSKSFNNKKFFSVVLMGVVDTKYKFLAIDVGAYDGSGDARVMEASQIKQKMLHDENTLPAPRPLPGTTRPLPFVMVSDEAVNVTPCQLRPFPRKGLDTRRRVFNYRLSRARRYIECTFGILTKKWKIVSSSIQLDVATVDAVVKACCILHNYVIDHDGPDKDAEATVPSLATAINWQTSKPDESELELKDLFADYFMTPEGSVPWQMACVSGTT